MVRFLRLRSTISSARSQQSLPYSFWIKQFMYIKNSGVAQAPASIDDTMNTILIKPPQKLFRFVGAVELPPIEFVPPISQGYIVMDAQQLARFVSSFLYIKWWFRRSMYSSAKSLPYIFLIRSTSSLRLRRMNPCLGSSPISVAMFLCSTFALASNFEPVAAFDATQQSERNFIFSIVSRSSVCC